MEIKELQSWDNFESVLEELTQSGDGQKELSGSELLFRGQSNANWKLETTLERSMGTKMPMMEYFDLINRVQPRIETFTDRNWKKIEWKEFYEWLNKTDTMNRSRFPAYDYMVYLRHYGFPSPLLDWTASPYVATYFAFRDILNTAETVAIFAYRKHFGVDSGWLSAPNISVLGSNVRSDERHFLQQSTYTICTEGEGDGALYCSHEEVFARSTGRHFTSQDMLWKIIVPSSERKKALRKLESYNINAYSLFRSEESLMETVFLQEGLFK
jgi:FRG domain